MKKVKFTKMHWCWNDFIVIRSCHLKELDIELTPDIIKLLCDRHFWIWSDWLLVFTWCPNVVKKYIMYNPDWSRAEMCGNWIRCFMKYLKDRWTFEWNEVDVETDIWMLNLKYENWLVVVDMWKPRMITNFGYETKKLWDSFLMKKDDKTFKFTPVSMWNPHAVIYLRRTKLLDLNIEKYWKAIENSIEIFPEKTNVEFIELVSNTEINMRVWERWAAETLACGTWACASVVAWVLSWDLAINEFVKVNLKWWTMWVKWDWNAKNSVIMKWPAEITFEWEYYLN